VHCPASQRRTGRSKLELADIFRVNADRLPALSEQQTRVVRDITTCRTAARGGHIDECDACGHQRVSYNSCRNRHCPKCQSLEQARWLEAQQKNLLPTEYHHVVFTVPDVLHPVFLANPRQAYNLLFAAAAQTLRDVALRPRNLGAKIGFSAVLHTWTQTLLYHPHLHCIVTGGGLHPDGTRWVSAKPRFLFAVRILARVFRGKLLEKLERGLEDGTMHSSCAELTDRLRKAARKDWVVYSKPPFAGPEQVLRYLGRYTHRTAISNQRLVSMQQAQVTFRWKDRARDNQTQLMSIDAAEFMRRFLLHVLPKGLMRIRHYGLLANSLKAKLVPICRQLLGGEAADAEGIARATGPETWQELLRRQTGEDVTLCPECRKGHLVFLRDLPALHPLCPVRPAARSP
jgi:hypothetical protein